MLNTLHSLSVHPCDKDDKGGCEQVCEKKGEEAVCKCNEGFKPTEEDANKCEEGKDISCWKCYDNLLFTLIRLQ